MVIVWRFIFYCTLNFCLTTWQPLLFSPAEQYLDISAKSGLGNSSSVFYLRKLSCRRGCGEGVGYHGTEYIQVIVLACARATIVSWCSCWCVCEREVKKQVLQAENKCTPLGKTTPCETFLTALSITHWQFPNSIQPASTQNLWKAINKIIIQPQTAAKNRLKPTNLFANVEYMLPLYLFNCTSLP